MNVFLLEIRSKMSDQKNTQVYFNQGKASSRASEDSLSYCITLVL